LTRNSRKLQREPSPDYKEPQQSRTPTTNNNPFGLSFVVGTDKVSLPSKGKFYPKDSCFYNIEEVEIKHMTAREEDILSTTEATEGEESIFDRLIDGIFVNKDFSAAELLDEDKMAILLKARETGYGKEYKTVSYCDKCEQTTEQVFDLSKVKTRQPSNEVVYDADENCFIFNLPITKFPVKARRLTSEDTKELEEEKEKKLSLSLNFNYTLSYLNKVVLSANDVVDKPMLNKFFDIMPAADAKYILNFHKDLIPSIDTKQEVQCSNCQAMLEKEVPLSWAFFRTEF